MQKGNLYSDPIFFQIEGSFAEDVIIMGIVNFKSYMVYGGHMKLAGQVLSWL